MNKVIHSGVIGEKKEKETRKVLLIMENNNKGIVKHFCVGERGEGSRTE